MPRLMSVALTEQAVRERRKTVTRRLGWATLQPGTELDLCRKVMGRKRTDGTVEPLVRLARVRVIDVHPETLHTITRADVLREGFTDDDLWEYGLLNPLTWRFVAFFCEAMRCLPNQTVNRIEWTYRPTPADWPTP